MRWLFAAALLLTSCAADDPIVAPATTTTAAPTTSTSSTTTTTWTTTTTTTSTTTTTTTSTTTTTTTTVAPSSPPRILDDVPALILEAVQSLWPEDQWALALEVAWCESGYRLDVKNPTSSASGLFQILIPWAREPGTGREVWGWEYTAKARSSAAVYLEYDARWTIRNAEVAYEIWRRAGGSWSAWNASRHCWG